MPRGGFGNLIALPLQHEARKRGNTLFLDDGLVPYPEPWAYLVSVERRSVHGRYYRRGRPAPGVGDRRAAGPDRG